VATHAQQCKANTPHHTSTTRPSNDIWSKTL